LFSKKLCPGTNIFRVALRDGTQTTLRHHIRQLPVPSFLPLDGDVAPMHYNDCAASRQRTNNTVAAATHNFVPLATPQFNCFPECHAMQPTVKLCGALYFERRIAYSDAMQQMLLG